MIVNGLGGIQFGWKEPGDRERESDLFINHKHR